MERLAKTKSNSIKYKLIEAIIVMIIFTSIGWLGHVYVLKTYTKDTVEVVLDKMDSLNQSSQRQYLLYLHQKKVDSLKIAFIYLKVQNQGLKNDSLFLAYTNKKRAITIKNLPTFR